MHDQVIDWLMSLLYDLKLTLGQFNTYVNPAELGLR